MLSGGLIPEIAEAGLEEGGGFLLIEFRVVLIHLP